MFKRFSSYSFLISALVFSVFHPINAAQSSPKSPKIPAQTITTTQPTEAPLVSETPKPLPSEEAVLVTDPNALGTPYSLPTLPPQTSKGYSLLGGYSLLDWKVGFSYDAYLLGLISHGTYNNAASNDTRIPGWNNVALLNIITAMVAQLQKNRLAQRQLLEDQRKATLTQSDNVSLLLDAINGRKQKLVALARVQEEYERIQEERRKSFTHAAKILKEFYEQDVLQKKLLAKLSDAHSEGKTPLPVSPTKSFKEFSGQIFRLSTTEANS